MAQLINLNLFKKLPREIETIIWNLYYMDVYKENIIQEINNIMCIEKMIEKNIENMQIYIRKIRFSNDDEIINVNDKIFKNFIEYPFF